MPQLDLVKFSIYGEPDPADLKYIGLIIFEKLGEMYALTENGSFRVEFSTLYKDSEIRTRHIKLLCSRILEETDTDPSRTIRNIERLLHVDRKGVLSELIKEPTFPKLVKAIKILTDLNEFVYAQERTELLEEMRKTESNLLEQVRMKRDIEEKSMEDQLALNKKINQINRKTDLI